ncbi:MAG: DUF3014 domain-containing protein [Pseudomonadota bacterium]|nr:DUF3014 domain-containing protein [Pseudomonadota bacterium]
MMDEDLAKPTLSKPVVGIGAALLIAVLAGWYYWTHHGAAAKPPVIAPPPTAAAAAPPKVEHPLAAPAETPQAPLPELNDSDKAIADAIGGAAPAALQFLVPENIARHIVVTVDNLARQKVAVDKRPLTPVAGTFIANGDELHATLDSRNFRRYVPLVEAVRQADAQRVAAVYLRFYPLLQTAYQDLGYPTGYFNDRVVKTIDMLLATPQITAPIELVRPNVMYVYADPSLESRPAGQKLLMRMGPDNAAAIKAKLQELRAIITGTPPRH